MSSARTAGGAFGPVIDRLRDDSERLFGASPLAVEPVREVRGPFSQVLEVKLRAGGQSVTAFIKILAPRAHSLEELKATGRNAAREFDALVSAHGALAKHPGLSTARPMACYPELFALITERVEGTPLNQLLSRLRVVPSSSTVDSLERIMRSVGAWLAAFQTTGASDAGVSLGRMRTYLDARLQPLALAGVLGEDLRAGLLRYFDYCAREVTATELIAVPVHADFTPENVMVSDDGVAVLDFTMAKHGARYLDLTHMYMHLDMLKARPWFRPGILDRQGTALLAGFDAAVRPERPLFQLLLMQHVVCYIRQGVQQQISSLPARVLSRHVRRRHLKWLAARASSC